MFSIACGLLVCVCVTYRSLDSNMGGPVNDSSNPIKWYPSSMSGLFNCLAIAELTFSCHFNILPMHSELRHQSRNNKRTILCLAMGIVYALNVTISYFGYFQVKKNYYIFY